MSFLIPFFKERETITSVNIHINDECNNFSTHEDDEADIDALQVNNEEDHLTSQPSASLVPTVQKRNKNKQENASAVLMNYILNNRKETPQQVQNTTTDVDIFFQSMATTVKKFSPYNQANAKAKVFSIISEMEFNELSQKECQPPLQITIPSPLHNSSPSVTQPLSTSSTTSDSTHTWESTPRL